MKFFAKKSLGQHFLNSPHVLRQIIDAARITKGETVLEIGPGTGILTQALLDAGANVTAIEKDDITYKMLNISEQLAPSLANGDLKLIHGDILELDPNALGLNGGEYAIVANIPYYITGAILEKFLENDPRPNRMILLVQKEVADRIVAKSADGNEVGGKESILSISVKAFGTPRKIASVPRGAFTPAPTVDSAILSITDISDRRFWDAQIEIPRFFELVRAGFAHKRKFLIRNLESVVNPDRLKIVWQKLGLSEKVRAEELKIEDWISIATETK
jgi:16S rRNA (adenine1518-N6/adenine1519-N6)-dimethyltransferase